MPSTGCSGRRRPSNRDGTPRPRGDPRSAKRIGTRGQSWSMARVITGTTAIASDFQTRIASQLPPFWMGLCCKASHVALSAHQELGSHQFESVNVFVANRGLKRTKSQ
jgi:hypothetical protein